MATTETSATGVWLLDLFVQADIVVKLVMLGLLLASVWTWTIIVAQWRKMRRINRENEQFETRLLAERGHRQLLRARARATCPRPRCSPPASPNGAARPRAGRSTRTARATAWRSPCTRRSRPRPTGSPTRLNILATIGSVAPFVGLFGTVLGHHAQLHRHRRPAEHQPGGGRARHRRGPVRDRDRPVRGDPGGDRLQPLQPRHQPARGAAAALRRRLPRARLSRELEVES